jgi:hypothetical protein
MEIYFVTTSSQHETAIKKTRPEQPPPGRGKKTQAAGTQRDETGGENGVGPANRDLKPCQKANKNEKRRNLVK